MKTILAIDPEPADTEMLKAEIGGQGSVISNQWPVVGGKGAK